MDDIKVTDIILDLREVYPGLPKTHVFLRHQPGVILCLYAETIKPNQPEEERKPAA